MTPHEKLEAVHGWFHRAKLDTSRLTFATIIAVWDYFGGAVVPDRIGLEIALGNIKTAQS